MKSIFKTQRKKLRVRAEQAYSDIYVLSSQKLFNSKKTFAVNNIIVLIAKYKGRASTCRSNVAYLMLINLVTSVILVGKGVPPSNSQPHTGLLYTFSTTRPS